MFDCQLLCVSIPPPVSYLFFSHPWILPQCEFVMFATNCFLNNRLPVARRTNMGSQSKRKKKKENHLENLFLSVGLVFLYCFFISFLYCLSAAFHFPAKWKWTVKNRSAWSTFDRKILIPDAYPVIRWLVVEQKRLKNYRSLLVQQYSVNIENMISI